MKQHFWLTWSERKNDYVRRKTGVTLAELSRECNRLGFHWELSRQGNGMWFEFDDDPSQAGNRKGRRR